jgi:uncharacterized membrane protein
MSLLRVLASCMVLCVFSALQVQAQKATCTNWNLWLLNPADPRNPLEQADGVNDNRTVVGLSYPLSSKLMPPYWGFVHYFSGKVTYWHPANAKKSWFTGRNNVGNTVGNYIDTLGVLHAAYLHGSITSLIVHPKAVHHSTYLIDVNNLNTILGVYSGSDGVNHLFKRRSNGTFLSVPNFPGAQVTWAGAFNDNGVVVGGYILPGDPGDIQRGFIYRNGSFAPVNYRNTFTHTDLVGIDNNGVIVGNWYANGFLYKNGVFKDIVGPHGEYVTARGISANGIITGDIWSKSMATHGFTATCQ